MLKRLWQLTAIVIIALVALTLASTPVKRTSSSSSSSSPSRVVFAPEGFHHHDDDLVAEYTKTPGPSFPAPAALLRAPETAKMEVNFIGSAWTPEAKNALLFAVHIWSRLLVSSETIDLDVDLKDLGQGILGGAAPGDFVANFSGAPTPNTWYPIALANSLAGTDLNGGNADIVASFSSTFDWYYGTDGNTPINKFDFVTVAFHEIGHGLGFTGDLFVGNDGNGYWFTPYPSSYDRFTENGSGQALLSFPWGSSELASQLQSESVYFDGSNANAANGNSRVRLYAPSQWNRGSSYSHLDNDFNGTDNALMTFSVSNGVAIHNPGAVTLALLKDTGWDVQQAPVIDSLPAQLLEVDTTKIDAYDLYNFITDGASDGELTIQLINNNTADAGISLDNGRYISIEPKSGWTGTANATIRATNPLGLSNTQTFEVVVLDNLYEVFAPLAIND